MTDTEQKPDNKKAERNQPIIAVILIVLIILGAIGVWKYSQPKENITGRGKIITDRFGPLQ